MYLSWIAFTSYYISSGFGCWGFFYAIKMALSFNFISLNFIYFWFPFLVVMHCCAIVYGLGT